MPNKLFGLVEKEENRFYREVKKANEEKMKKEMENERRRMEK